jgi:aspartate kinase
MKSSVSVLKFGGTSVGSGERIRRAAHIIEHHINEPGGAFPVVVVSAMSGITDQLLRIAHYSSSGQYTACEHELGALKQRHLEAAEKAVYHCEGQHTLHHDLETAFAALEQDVAALQPAAKGTQSVSLLTSAAAAWGERLSVLLVAAAARDAGLAAAAVREEVIITGHPQDEAPGSPGGEVKLTVAHADPLTEETRVQTLALIHPLIEHGIIPIVAGFIGRTVGSPGSSARGFVTTLGRNGSDYSAAMIGAALDCIEVCIYSDVDGVLTADPRVVANTLLLPRLSYAEAARLSWFGAKVLHPRTLIPLAHRNIPVRVRNTFRPHTRGTVVGPEGKQHSAAAAITARRHLALITVESTDMFGAPENAGQVFALAARAGAAPVAICSSSGQHLSFVVEEQAADSVVALLQHDMGAWRVLSRRNLAACACIGSGFSVDAMSPARAVTALARERIPVITQGASELAIILIVEDRDSERAVRCLHRDLVAPVIPLVRHSTHEKRRETLQELLISPAET